MAKEMTPPPPSASLLYFPAPQLTHLAAPSAGSSPPSANPRLGSAQPEALVAEPAPYSLLDDIHESTSQRFAGGLKEKVSLYGFPSYLTVNLRRVLSRNRSHHSDWAIAFSCLMNRGILHYLSNPASQTLSAGLLALDTDDALTGVAAEQVEIWRRGFRFSIPDPTHGLGLEKCRTFRAPEYVHAALFDLAGQLGLSGSVLGIVCIMAALEDQDGVIEEHGRYMRETVQELDTLLAERSRRLRALVYAIETGVYR